MSTALTGLEVNAPDHQVVVVQHDRSPDDCRQQERENGKEDTEWGGSNQCEHESMKPVRTGDEPADLGGFTDCSPWL